MRGRQGLREAHNPPGRPWEPHPGWPLEAGTLGLAAGGWVYVLNLKAGALGLDAGLTCGTWNLEPGTWNLLPGEVYGIPV